MERIDKSKIGKILDQLQPLLRWTKKVGILWFTNKKVMGSNVLKPIRLFSGDYISALRGC